MLKHNRVRVGLIGLGWMGKEHARNLLANPRVQLVAIADSAGDQVEAFVKKNAITCAHYADYRQLLKAKVDAVVVATPNHTHAEICVAAARQRKHIYCEKPMAISLADCRQVREAVEKAGVKYLIGYHRRLNPLYQYAKGLVTAGTLGNPFMIESDYLHHVPGDLDIWSWLGNKAIAGSLFHAGSGHNVDLIRYFLGEITEVAAFKGAFLPRQQQVETEDTAVAIFKFQNGAIGKVQCCVGPILPFTFNLRIYGTRGSVLNNKVYLDTLPRFTDPAHEKDCIELPGNWVPDNVQGGISEPWNKLMDHFIDMLAENAPCLNDVSSAYQTSMACFAAMQAAETGKVIEIRRMAS